MKEGWKYKKLGEVCKITTGKHDANHAKEGGAYRFYTCAAQYVYCDTYTFDGNCLILPGNGANVGDVYAYSGKFDAYQRTYVLSNIKTEEIYFKYLYYFFLGNWRKKGTANQYGTATNYIIMRNFTDFTIGYPHFSEQQMIVEELDLLSSIIEKKKAQLNELDNLAQSLFYEMFGDPITNEKGWEVKKFKDVYKLKSGDGLSAKQFEEGPYPVYGGNGISGFHKTYNMDGEYIIVGRVGVYCGNVRNVNGKFWLTDNAFQLFYDSDRQLPTFIKYMLTLLDLHQYANKAAQAVISNTSLKGIDILFPPLALQQQFASQIQTIEHQKELIKQSIKEVETLFNSRMDDYFN